MVNWNVSKADALLIADIADRAVQIDNTLNLQETQMDLTAVHGNGNPLRLNDLAQAKSYDLMHDIYGIRRHLNRRTGKLSDFFTPRHSVSMD